MGFFPSVSIKVGGKKRTGTTTAKFLFSDFTSSKAVLYKGLVLQEELNLRPFTLITYLNETILGLPEVVLLDTICIYNKWTITW